MPVVKHYQNDIMYINTTIPHSIPIVMGVVLLMGNVRLSPPPSTSSYLPGTVKLIPDEMTPEEFDGSVTIKLSEYKPGSPDDIIIEGSSIVGSVTFDNTKVPVQSNDIIGRVELVDTYYRFNLLDPIELIVPQVIDWDFPIDDPTVQVYESTKYGNADLYGVGKLIEYDYKEPDNDISGSGHLTYEWYKKFIMEGTVSLPKIKENEDIECTVSILPEDYNTDPFDIVVRVPRFEVNVYIDTRIIVPKFRVQYSIPIDIEVVPGYCTCFPVDIDVVNECIWEFDGNVSLPKIEENDDIDSTVTLLPESYEDIDCHVKLNKLATYRQIDATGYLIGRVINDFDIDITTEEYEDPVYEYSKDIMDCVVHFGGKSLFDFDIFIKTESIPLFDFKEDVINGMVHLRDYKRIGIVVDPRWNYDAYVFKSSLLTLFDKYYDKTVLDIVYGGHPRSDWDIEHLGYVFHNKLTKVPIVFDPIHPDHTKRTIEHYIYHLSTMPVSKVFLFTDRPDYIASNPLSLITQFCKDNDIDFAIITSGGEFVDYHDNQAFSTTTNPLRTEPHSVLGPLAVMPMDHFNRVADPSDPKHPYYHPTKIIY